MHNPVNTTDLLPFSIFRNLRRSNLLLLFEMDAAKLIQAKPTDYDIKHIRLQSDLWKDIFNH